MPPGLRNRSPTIRVLAGVVVAIALSAASPGAAAARQPSPGFEAQLRGEGIAGLARPECHLFRRTLTCTFAGELPADASCSAGGAVPSVVLTRRGRARQTYVCMDEGFHDWKVLRPGRRWRKRGFRCHHRWRGEGVGRHTVLRCSNGRRGFTVRPSGEVALR